MFVQCYIRQNCGFLKVYWSNIFLKRKCLVPLVAAPLVAANKIEKKKKRQIDEKNDWKSSQTSFKHSHLCGLSVCSPNLLATHIICGWICCTNVWVFKAGPLHAGTTQRRLKMAIKIRSSSWNNNSVWIWTAGGGGRGVGFR